MSAELFNLGLRCFDRWNDSRLQLRATCEMSLNLSLIAEIGCPALLFKIINTGKRPAKIARFVVAVRGNGFVQAMREGFGNEAFANHVPPPIPELQEEELQVYCLPLDKPNDPHGWTLQRDDIVRFIYPIATPASITFATSLVEKLCGRVILFDDTEIDLVDGEKIQSYLRTGIDYCRDKEFGCHCDIKMSIRANSMNVPSPATFGLVNEASIRMPDLDPVITDFEQSRDSSNQHPRSNAERNDK
jgi:hypothetical protein